MNTSENILNSALLSHLCFQSQLSVFPEEVSFLERSKVQKAFLFLFLLPALRFEIASFLNIECSEQIMIALKNLISILSAI